MSGDDDGVVLGACCICGGTDNVRTVVMLERPSAVPGHGWGCVICGLPANGAYSVICDACEEPYRADPTILKTACRGYPSEGRIPIAELPDEPFDHDPAKHADEMRPYV